MMEQNDQREVWNNSTRAILIPPKKARQSWRAHIYSKKDPGRIFAGTRCLPGKVEGDCTSQKIKKNSIAGFLIQITNADQYVYLRGADGKSLVFEAFSGETSIIQDLVKEKKIILTGEIEKPKPEGPLYLTEVTFSMHEIKDQEIIDRIVNTAWRGKT